MRRLNLPDTQELIWFALGIWVAFFVRRMLRARRSGIAPFLMYLFLAAAPLVVIIFQVQFAQWLQDLREVTSLGK